MKQLLQLISVQFKEFLREPGVIFWSLAFPVLMAWGLGIAFTQQGEQVRHVAIVESGAPTPELSRFLKENSVKIQAGKQPQKYFKTLGNDRLGRTIYEFSTTSREDAIVKMKRGEIALILQEDKNGIHYHFDPKNSEAQVAYLQLSAAMSAKDQAGSAANVEPLTQTGTRYIDFLIPGLLAMGIMMSAMWGISYSLIEKRTKKLLRRMVATPMKKSGFLISHFISRVTLSAGESVLLLLFGWWYFDITVQGSFPAFIAVFLAGNIAFIGLAIFVSARTTRTEVGNGLINAVVMPMMIGSGIFFSYHNFPGWLIPLIQQLPLTMLADSMRSIFIEGADFGQVWLETALLSGMGSLFFALGLKIYKWY
jgi:ABC-type multidrug transport system permease subunit